MRFTNPGFDELTTEEIIEQHRTLQPLRHEHMRQIVDSGLASRLIGSFSTFNQPWNIGPLSEATTLYPFRTYAWNLPSSRMNELRNDLGYPSGTVAERDLLDEVIGTHADNYILMVGRREPITPGASQVHAYAAGLLMEQESAGLLGLAERRLPIRGIELSDMHLLERQLGEIASFANERDLTIIDRATLGEGKGVLIMSEPPHTDLA